MAPPPNITRTATANTGNDDHFFFLLPLAQKRLQDAWNDGQGLLGK